jgi:hypothetical protein
MAERTFKIKLGTLRRYGCLRTCVTHNHLRLLLLYSSMSRHYLSPTLNCVNTAPLIIRTSMDDNSTSWRGSWRGSPKCPLSDRLIGERMSCFPCQIPLVRSVYRSNRASSISLCQRSCNSVVHFSPDACFVNVSASFLVGYLGSRVVEARNTDCSDDIGRSFSASAVVNTGRAESKPVRTVSCDSHHARPHS